MLILLIKGNQGNVENGLKIQRAHAHVGSIPTSGTTEKSMACQLLPGKPFFVERAKTCNAYFLIWPGERPAVFRIDKKSLTHGINAYTIISMETELT